MDKRKRINNLLKFEDEGEQFFKEAFETILELNDKHKYNRIQLEISQSASNLNAQSTKMMEKWNVW